MPQSGYRSVTTYVKKKIPANKKRIQRIAKQNDLHCRTKKKWKSATTNSKHKLRKYPDLLVERRASGDFTGVIVGDITAFNIRGRDAFTACLTDLTNRETIGMAISSRNDTALALAALKDAAKRRPSLKGYIHHTDSDSRYCSDAYIWRLKKLKLQISMCKGNAYENAHAESFNAVLKRQEINISDYQNLNEARSSQLAFREKHSVIRPHSSNGGLTPVEQGFKLGIYNDIFQPSYPLIHKERKRKKEAKKEKERNLLLKKY